MSAPRSPRPRRPSLRHAPLGALVAAAAACLAVSLLRVPPDHLGFSAAGVHPPGWHLNAPWRRARLVPRSGRLERVDVDRSTPEGARLVVRLSATYEIDPGRIAGRAARVAGAGLESLVAEVAAGALASVPAALLIASPDGEDAGPAPLPAPIAAALAAALDAAGIETANLTARAGPAGAFAPASGGPPGAVAAMPAAASTGVRIVWIGLDGADWDAIDPLLRQGRLPRLARLISAGTRGALRSYDPMISPLLWTTMATGVGPDVHGVADFQAIDEATGRRVPISSRFRRVKAIWNILGDAGRTSGFVGWWASYPAEPALGFQVSNLVPFETIRPREAGAAAPAGITFPPGYLDEVRPRLATAAALRFAEIQPILRIGEAEFETARREVLAPPAAADAGAASRRAVERPVPLALSIIAGSRNYATIAADLARRRLDVTAVYFEGIDMMGHRFQHCMPPRMPLCPDEDFARYRDAVAGFYVYQDALVGTILDAAGPDATVMIVSDHGFKSGAARPRAVLPFTTHQPVEWHEEAGVIVLSGPAAARGGRVRDATLFDIAPTLLHLAGLPVAEDMPGRVLREALDPAFRRAFPVRSLATYEAVGTPRIAAAPGGRGAEQAEAELLASLRALGYIGGDAAGDAEPSASASFAPAPERPADTQVFYHRNLATYFLKRREYARAAEELRLANARQPLGKNYQLLAEALVGMGRPDQAIEVLEQGLTTLPGTDAESVLWAVRLHLSGAGGATRAAGTARRWAARTAAKPGLDETIAGLIAEHDGGRAAALGHYRRALDLDPTRVVAGQRLYALEPEATRDAVLEPILRRALELDRRIDEYHDLLGVVLARRGRTADALASFRRAADLDPQNARFALNLAGAYALAGRWEEAASEYARAAALDPSSAVYLKLGSAHRRLGRPREALAAFERARALGDAGSAPILGIALARAEMDDVPRALAALQDGLGRHPADAALRSLYDDLLRRRRSRGSVPDRPGSGR